MRRRVGDSTGNLITRVFHQRSCLPFADFERFRFFFVDILWVALFGKRNKSEKLQVSKFSIEVYDLGGGKSIRKMWENYYAEAHGFIFVVDASDEERMAEAKTALQKALSHAYVRVSEAEARVCACACDAFFYSLYSIV